MLNIEFIRLLFFGMVNLYV